MSIVGSKMKQQAGALRCLASTHWGYKKSTLRSTYVATGRLTVELQQMTPAAAILAKANPPTIATRATQLSTIAMEKSIQMPDTNPRWQIAAT